MKLRLRSTKLGKIRFTSHRDVARMWERALRRAELPIANTEGFTPRPKISFGLALPTGAESVAEYVDIELRRDLAPGEIDDLPAVLTATLPGGIEVVVAAERDAKAGSLQEIVTSCTWELWGPGLDDEHLRDACRLLGAASLELERERKGKRSVDDVRPMILDLRVAGGRAVDPLTGPPGDRLVADLATVGRGLRPNELARLAFPDVDPLDVRALRTHQWTEHDGRRCEVLPYEPAVDADVTASPIEALA